ncbi:MAG: HAMP domain-containing histidine kinase [Armatimonadetes bacterium]|nr:HAMP domain-containing histidine kinase [Armatimonadota bacterium]
MARAVDDTFRMDPGEENDLDAPRASAGGVDALTLRQFMHQIRSHLTAIGPAAEFIAQPDVSDELRSEMADIVRQAVDRIEGLLVDMSVVVTPDRMETEASMVTVDLVEVARAAVRSQMGHAQTVGAWLVVDAAGGCPPVTGHPPALRRAVSNAVMEVLRVAREGDRVVVRMTPLGNGTSTEIDLRVEIEPGGSGHQRSAEPVEFASVSLDAARIIAERHGGTLEGLSDRPGLVMRLPAAPLRLRPAAAAAGVIGAVAATPLSLPSTSPFT